MSSSILSNLSSLVSGFVSTISGNSGKGSSSGSSSSWNKSSSGSKDKDKGKSNDKGKPDDKGKDKYDDCDDVIDTVLGLIQPLKAAISTKVASLTGAAKDETFQIQEQAGPVRLDVLANDPGSARLWSLDQNALDIVARCLPLPENLSTVTLASGARISVNADGTINYIPGAAQLTLAQGEVFVDSFTYVIRMANGALSSAKATVKTTGINDPAVFGGNATGAVQEDGTLVASGTLTVTDTDKNQAKFVSTGALQGSYGSFTFDIASGQWTYTLDNAKPSVQALNDGDVVQDKLQVFSVDGSSSFVTIDIAGKTDASTGGARNWVLTASNVVKDATVTQLQNGYSWSGSDVHSTVQFPDGPSIGTVVITGFDPDDILYYTEVRPNSTMSDVYDYNDDGIDDVVLAFSSGTSTTIEVVLLGVSDPADVTIIALDPR